MARPIRVEYPDAVYHVTARGNEKKAVFRDDEDREKFLTTLQQTVERYGIKVHGFCLMPNHYHLLLQTPQGNLSRSVGWLQTTYTIRYNRRHKRSGHLFQGRYKAHLVEEDSYGVQLIKYIHLNPVRPKDKQKAIPRERKGELDSYKWSSHRTYAGLDKGNSMPWLAIDWLSYFGSTEKRAQQEYHRQIEEMFGKENTSPWEALQHGLILGGEELCERVQEILAGAKGQEEIRWQQRTSAERIARDIEEMAESEEDKRIAMWIRVCLGGQRMTEVGARYGYRDGSGVHQVVKRLEERARKDKELSEYMQKLACKAGVRQV